MNNIELVPGSPAPTQGDLSNGFYPQLTKVDLNSTEFKEVVEWLVSLGAPTPKAKVGLMLQLDGTKLAPTSLVFTNNSGTEVELDASLVYNFPHVALVDLENYFNFGDPKVLKFYPGRVATPVTPPTAPTPIGVSWPEQGPNAFRPSNDDHYPFGATYQDSTGTYFKESQRWVFVTFPVWRKK